MGRYWASDNGIVVQRPDHVDRLPLRHGAGVTELLWATFQEDSTLLA